MSGGWSGLEDGEGGWPGRGSEVRTECSEKACKPVSQLIHHDADGLSGRGDFRRQSCVYAARLSVIRRSTSPVWKSGCQTSALQTTASMTVLPNAAKAEIEEAKLRDYLLSSAHPVGRFKAYTLNALGYTRENWVRLHHDLLNHGRAGDCVVGDCTLHGQKFKVSGTLVGPNGRRMRYVSVWIIAPDSSTPRFITAFPE